jgi:hypothetical protein
MLPSSPPTFPHQVEQINSIINQTVSQRPDPNFVLDCAVSNESRDKMLEDVNDKYFADTTSVQGWVGIKIRLSAVGNGESYWVGWGRRGSAGYGLRLVEDEAGLTAFLPVYLPQNVTQLGSISIPANLIFHPLPPPAAAADPFTITFEEIRSSIMRGLAYQP